MMRENSQTKAVLQASMVALPAPLSRFVTLRPKKLKNAMEAMLPNVHHCSTVDCPISCRSSSCFKEEKTHLSNFLIGWISVMKALMMTA